MKLIALPVIAFICAPGLPRADANGMVSPGNLGRFAETVASTDSVGLGMPVLGSPTPRATGTEVTGSSAVSAPESTGSPSPSPTPAAAPSGAPASTPPQITAKNTTVVSAPKLIVMLPDPPPGWSSDKPEGETSESEGFPITTVGCVYVKGDADDAPTATVNIIDSANNQQFQDATKAMWSATSNTPAGYDKTVTVAGLPGFEHYSNADKTGVLWVIVGGRFFVQVETTRLAPAELEKWLNLMDLKKLAALK